jgi:hypothetical protein
MDGFRMLQEIPWKEDSSVVFGDSQWLGDAVLECLKQLGCDSPPVLPEYFLFSPSQEVTRRNGVKSSHHSASGTERSVSAHHAAKIAANDYLRRNGLGLAQETRQVLLDRFSTELLAPTPWLAGVWKNKAPLVEIARLFPCLQGENLALRLAQFWSTTPGVATSWFQGGQRIWSSEGGCKACGIPPSDLEVAAWTSSREYSRPVVLREHGQEIHAAPFHDGFPKGEVLVHFPSGFHG